MLLAACIQMGAGPERADNERRALRLVDEAAGRGAGLVALPEMWEHVGPADAKRAFAGPLEGSQLAPLRELCARRAIWCLAGSVAEIAADGRFHNTSALLAPDGSIAARYRKVHLFDVDVPDGVRYRESDAVSPGDEPPPVVELAGTGLRAGLSVCYDIRFPELYRSLAARGADVLFVPAAFTAYTGRAHWEVLLRARAIESQAWVLAPAQVGRIGPPQDDRFSWGHASIVDPWGEVLADAGETPDSIVLAALDPGTLARVRRELPALRHQRPDLFGRVAKPPG